MLDTRKLIENTDGAADLLKLREPDFDRDKLIELDKKRRQIIQDVEAKKAEQNKASKEIGARKKAGESVDDIMESMSKLSADIKGLDSILSDLNLEIKSTIEKLPNLPLKDLTPVGIGKTANVVRKTFKDPVKPENWDFKFRNHLEVAATLSGNGGLDFERAAKITGTNWPLYRGDLARLEWALVLFLLDKAHTSPKLPGIETLIPPFIANEDSMRSSGQFPKFRDQAFEIEKDNLVLIPTSEVPLLNFFRGEILEDAALPVRLAAYTPCFRREAGTYGKDERGLIRLHQFNKVEIFSYIRPDEAMTELEKIVEHAESIVEALDLPYRTSVLGTGDLAQQAAYTIDIEVWLPGQDKFSEVSSVSNCTDYQARRADIRYRPEEQKKPEFLYTLNGSALATSRVMVSILEHYQLDGGGMAVPTVLQPYMSGQTEIKP